MMRSQMKFAAAAACLLTAAGMLTACRDGGPGFVSTPSEPATGPLRQLTFSATPDLSPTWSANSDTVYYTAVKFVDFPKLGNTLLRIARSGGVTTLLAPDAQPNGANQLFLPVPSPTHDRIAYVHISQLNAPAICTIGPTDNPACAGSEPLVESGFVRIRAANATTPATGDPGVVIPFQGVDPLRSAGGAEAYLQRFFPFQKKYADSNELLFRPTWAPDGQRIAFSDGLALRLWRVAETTSTVIPNTVDAVSPAWSPSGDRIAFTRLVRGDSTRITCSCSEGGASRPVTHVRWLYTVSRSVVTLINPDGTNAVELTDGGEPAWSPDGGTLYFTKQSQVYRIPASGGTPVLVPQTLGARSPSVSPDGKWLAFARTTLAGADPDIWILSLISQ